jgi:hypothetical protein
MSGAFTRKRLSQVSASADERPPVEKAAAFVAVEAAEGHVADDGLREEQPLGQPVLGDIADLRAGRRDGIAQRHRLPVERDRPAVGLHEPEERLGERGPPAAEKPRDAQHLALADVEAHVAERTGLVQPLHAHQRFGRAG